MPRELNTYLTDILDAIRKIEKYTINLSYDDFVENELVQDGVVRNLEVIGEAVKKIPEDVRRSSWKHPSWKNTSPLSKYLH